MKTLQAWALQYRKLLLILIVSQIILGFIVIGQAYAIVQTVDSVFIQQTDFGRVLPYLGALAIILLIRALLNYVNARIGLTLSTRVRKSIRTQLLSKWSKQPVEYTGQALSGGRLSTLIESVDQLDPYFKDYVPQVIKTIILPIAILAAAFYVNPNSGWIMLITAPFIPLSYILVGLKTQQKSERQLAELSRFSGKFLDILQGLQTLKIFGRGKEQAVILKNSNDGFQKTTLSILKIAFASSFFIELIITLGIGLLALEIGFQMLVFETLAFAPAFFILAIAPEYYTSLKELGAAFHTGRGSLAAADQLSKELEKEERPVRWGISSITSPISIEMNDVKFTYDQGFTLSIDQLFIKPGERAVIIGPSGQGKTTLLNLLAGIYENKIGTLLINGQTRETVNEESWWSQVSYISQHPYLFSGTLRDNFSMGKSYTDQEVATAVAWAGLSDLISSLPQGVDTTVGEGGRGLSGGEKQRVALARSFLKKPKLVFYDEPTVGLDVKTEQILSRSIDQLAKEATIVTVAHRLPTIRKADQLYVIQDGQLVDTGTPQNLAKKNAYYQSILKGGGQL